MIREPGVDFRRRLRILEEYLALLDASILLAAAESPGGEQREAYRQHDHVLEERARRDELDGERSGGRPDRRTDRPDEQEGRGQSYIITLVGSIVGRKKGMR